MSSKRRPVRRLLTIVGVLGAAFVLVMLATPLASASAASPNKTSARFEIGYMEFTINHHFMGVEMAWVCERKASHSALRQLCANAVVTQGRQIKQLQTWLKSWYGITYQPRLTGQDQRMLNTLRSLSRARFEATFLTMFSEHHVTIIRRSAMCLTRASHEPLLHLCKDIVVEQSKEVHEMRDWLCAWYGRCGGLRH